MIGLLGRHVLILILAVLFTSLVHAQFGFKGGITLSGFQPHKGDRYIMGDDYRPFLGYEIDWLQEDNAYPDLGFQLGIFYKKSFSRRSSLQPELYIAQRGVNFIHRKQYNTAYYLNVTYVQVPLLFRFDLTTTRKVKPGLITGPYGSLKLRSNRKLEIWGDRDMDKVSGLSPWDVGWIFAFTTEWPAWSGHLIAEFRIDYGLHNTMFQPARHTDIYVDAGKVRVMAVSIMTGYRIEGR